MEGGDWEHSLESGGVERSGGIRFVVCGRGMVTGAELWSSDIVMFGQDHWLLQMFFFLVSIFSVDCRDWLEVGGVHE